MIASAVFAFRGRAVMKLHQMHRSGNCYKVRLAARQLGMPIALVDVDLAAGETRSEAFRAKNPNGKVPVLELADGRFLPESNAILWYLAENSPLIPQDKFARAEALQWMFFEQYSHEPYIAVARYWLTLAPKAELEKRRDKIPEWQKAGNAALKVMDQHLAKRDWFAGPRYSVADIALYGYTHVAGEGGFDLGHYPHVKRWLARVEAEPGFIPMAERW